MPRGDGTGPAGQGPGTGRGKLGTNRGLGRKPVSGRGRMGGPFAAGFGGICVCPACGFSSEHIAGQPCNQKICPECGQKMTRG